MLAKMKINAKVYMMMEFLTLKIIRACNIFGILTIAVSLIGMMKTS